MGNWLQRFAISWNSTKPSVTFVGERRRARSIVGDERLAFASLLFYKKFIRLSKVRKIAESNAGYPIIMSNTPKTQVFALKERCFFEEKYLP
jgi:hypothetical protein